MTGHRIVRINEEGAIVTEDVKTWLDDFVSAKVELAIEAHKGDEGSGSGLTLIPASSYGSTFTIDKPGLYYSNRGCNVQMGEEVVDVPATSVLVVIYAQDTWLWYMLDLTPLPPVVPVLS